MIKKFLHKITLYIKNIQRNFLIWNTKIVREFLLYAYMFFCIKKVFICIYKEEVCVGEDIACSAQGRREIIA